MCAILVHLNGYDFDLVTFFSVYVYSAPINNQNKRSTTDEASFNSFRQSYKTNVPIKL